MPPLQFVVAGSGFRQPGRLAEVARLARRLSTTFQLRLQREPTNRYDANAVRVYAGEVWLGYVPRAIAAELAPVLDAGRALSASLVRTYVQQDVDYDPIRFEIAVREVPS